MTKVEFLAKLRQALGNDLTGPVIEENVNYYSQYISDEVNSGKSEEEVIRELGDPWVIARTIIDAQGTAGASGYDSAYENSGRQYEATYDRQGGFRQIGIPGRISIWKMILILLGIVGIFILAVAVIGGIISFIAPILIPALVIVFVFRVLGQRK